MEHRIAIIIADLIGLPDWMPRLLTRGVGIVLCFTGIFFTPVLMQGLEIWAHQEASSFMNRIAPLLHPPRPAGSTPTSR